MLLFSSQNLSEDNFLYHPRFFTLTKNLNTARTPTEMKQNLLFSRQDFH